MKTKLKNQKGFTIIEVLIVLAIAGLILLIVFLAIPALQRNQRNTARKTDVGRVAGAVSEWASNNNGVTITPGGAGAPNLVTVIASAGALSQYTLVPGAANGTTIGANSLTIAVGTQAAIPAGAANVNLGSMQIVTGATCGANGATVISTATRSTVLQSLVETAGVPTPVCQPV